MNYSFAMMEHMRSFADSHSTDHTELASDVATGYLCQLADIPPALSVNTASTSAVLFSAPHAGRYYASEIFAPDQLASASTLEEKGTDLITRQLSDAGYPALIATISRAVVDLNRPSFAQDGKLHPVTDAVNGCNARLYQSYISAGYGVIPRLDAQRRPLHKAMLEGRLVDDILALHHAPYHQTIMQMLNHGSAYNRHILLCDIHSMPDDHAHRQLPDIVFGNLHGASCSEQTVRCIGHFMKQSGYSWAWNTPYAGGYITRHYGLNTAIERCHVQTVQIEINRTLLETRHRQCNLAGLKQMAEMLCGLSERLADNLEML